METKICKKCGRELNRSHFKNNYLSADGKTSICRDCSKRARQEKKEKQDIAITPPTRRNVEGSNPDLAAFSPRDLILELKARGYKGKLTIEREVVL